MQKQDKLIQDNPVNSTASLKTTALIIFMLSLLSILYAILSVFSNSLTLLTIFFVSFAKLIGIYIVSLQYIAFNTSTRSLNLASVLMAISLDFSLNFWAVSLIYWGFKSNNEVYVKGYLIIVGTCSGILVGMILQNKVSQIYRIQRVFQPLEVFICILALLVGILLEVDSGAYRADFVVATGIIFVKLVYLISAGSRILVKLLNSKTDKVLKKALKIIDSVIYI